MLLGVDIHLFMDHKNLMFDTLKMQRALCWHTKIEEFSPMLHYIEGPCNILAGNLSMLHCLVTTAQIVEEKKLVEPAEASNEEEDKAYFLDQEYSGLYDDDIGECIGCYLNLPDTPHPGENPLNYAHICELQQQDKQLLSLQVKYPDNYFNLQLRGGIEILLPLDTHFLPEKKGFVGHNTKSRNVPEKQAKVCGQSKFTNVALSPSQGDVTSTLMHPMAYTIAQCCSRISRNAFIQTFLSLFGRLGQSNCA
jgi:hypothetical protein